MRKRLDAILGNYIFYIFLMYEFSHSLDPKRTPVEPSRRSRMILRSDFFSWERWEICSVVAALNRPMALAGKHRNRGGVEFKPFESMPAF